MDFNGITNNTGLAIAFLFLVVFGAFYNNLVERLQKHTQRYTAELVVGGVLVTVLISGFFIGWENMAKVLVLFVGSGLPMIVGSWKRAADDERIAKQIQKESIK